MSTLRALSLVPVLGSAFAPAAGPPHLTAEEHGFLDGIGVGFAAGDLDGDGRVDQVVAVNEKDGVYRLVTLKGDGYGSFSLAAALPIADRPGAVVANDFDGDGF